jgi:cardiolipin synthase
MACGVLGIGTLILSLFSSIGDRASKASLVNSCPVDSEDFLQALAGVLNSPLQSGGTAELLNNGDAYFPRMLDAIRSAEHTINFTTYIWQDGKVSSDFFEALTERAAAGVQVRVLVDGFGGMKAPDDGIEKFRAAGGKWAVFNAPRFGRLTRIHKRTHRRALLIDGRIGFTGGAAVMDKWLGNARNPDEWRDCMVEVRGNLAVNLQAAFTQIWTHATGELISGEHFYAVDFEEPASARREVHSISRHINVISSPSSHAHPMRHLFWLSISSAEKSLYITNPYFVPDATLAMALKDRAQRGVDVRVLVPNEHIDVPIIRWASQGYYDELLSAGVRIFEFQPTMLHQKLLVADGVWSLVGSTNMDVRSKELNQENSLCLQDRGFAADMEAAFMADLAQAREVKLEEWRRRAIYRKIPEQFARLFEEQF